MTPNSKNFNNQHIWGCNSKVQRNITLIESEGSEPDKAACLAAARLSTSSTSCNILNDEKGVGNSKIILLDVTRVRHLIYNFEQDIFIELLRGLFALIHICK